MESPGFRRPGSVRPVFAVASLVVGQDNVTLWNSLAGRRAVDSLTGEDRMRTLSMAAALVAVALGAPPANAGGKVYKTPQAAFDAFVAATKQEDWKTAYTILTDDTGKKLTGGMVFMGVFMK